MIVLVIFVTVSVIQIDWLHFRVRHGCPNTLFEVRVGQSASIGVADDVGLAKTVLYGSRNVDVHLRKICNNRDPRRGALNSNMDDKVCHLAGAKHCARASQSQTNKLKVFRVVHVGLILGITRRPAGERLISFVVTLTVK